jgi:hypothetical protein
MPNDTSSAATTDAAELPDGAAVSACQERRVSEQLISDWKEETRRLRHALALMTLDTSAMTGAKWAQRFIIAVNRMVEHSSLLFYGAGFASLLGLSAEPDKSVPISAQLPARYLPVFARGKTKNPRRALALAEVWRPWRAYAAMHLWKSLEKNL